jgi:hypothetical protein
MKFRRVSSIAVFASLLPAICGCGTSAIPSGSEGGSPAGSSTPQTSPAKDGSTSASSLTHPVSNTVAAWHFEWTAEGGYRYSASLALGKPEHIDADAIAPCTAESGTSAQILGTLTITNNTPNFPARPYVDFSSSQHLLFGAGEQCQGEGEGDNIGYQPDSDLQPGASSTNRVALVVPEYYSPEHPSGDTEALANYEITAETEVKTPGGEGAVPVAISGPDVTSLSPSDPSQFSLAALSR